MSLLLDVTGFEALFRVNYQPLCTTAYRIVQDKDIAEDIVQDVFSRLWERRGSLTISTSLKAYLIQSTINESINYIKKYKNSLSREEHYHAETAVDSNTTEQLLALKDISQRVEVAVRALPEVCRMVFILRRYEELSCKEIAGQLGISPKTVENHMTRALKHLSKCLLAFFSILSIFFNIR